MSLNWQDTLKTLLPQFEALAARSTGLHHLFVEVSDDERDKMFGPNWIARSLKKQLRIVNGEPVYEKWDVCKTSGLSQINPSFREPKPNETFDESASVIRDSNGVVRAVPVPMRLRQAFFCGSPGTADAFDSLGNIAATALAGATNLNEQVFASDLTDIFRKPLGGVRYIFGDVPATPKDFIASGWASGVLQFENGILVNVPIAETTPKVNH